MKTKFINGFFHLLEFFLVYVLINNAYLFILHTPDIPAKGPVAAILGGHGAVIFYGAVYLVLGLLLVASKFLKKKKLHQHSLYAIAITLMFVFFIELVVRGMGTYVIDTVVVFVLVTWAYLRWKIKIDYINPKEFRKELALLTKDT